MLDPRFTFGGLRIAQRERTRLHDPKLARFVEGPLDILRRLEVFFDLETPDGQGFEFAGGQARRLCLVGRQRAANQSAAFLGGDLNIFADDVPLHHITRALTGHDEQVGRSLPAGDVQSKATSRRDPQGIALGIARVPGVHDARGAGRNQAQAEHGDGRVDFRQSRGEAIEQCAFTEARSHDPPVGIDHLLLRNIDEAEKLSGEGALATFSDGTGAHRQTRRRPARKQRMRALGKGNFDGPRDGQCHHHLRQPFGDLLERA